MKANGTCEEVRVSVVVPGGVWRTAPLTVEQKASRLEPFSSKEEAASPPGTLVVVDRSFRGVIVVDESTVSKSVAVELSRLFPHAVLTLGWLFGGGVRFMEPGAQVRVDPTPEPDVDYGVVTKNPTPCGAFGASPTGPLPPTSRAMRLPPGSGRLSQSFAHELCRPRKHDHVRPQVFDHLELQATEFLRRILLECPVSPERSAAIERVREALMWAIASLVVVDEPAGPVEARKP